ncbi:MAG: peptidyl-prolyl cis-trans isomerase [Deferribacteraceae bacterium]|nr:peptidyl-prolyl cis-trans isomerase [Deferribacteraceae bacterium]
MSAQAEAATVVTLKTNYGDIVMELYPDKAPITVENFVNYVESGFYKGTIFHRVISNFMIQGGGMTVDMVSKSTNAPIKNEAFNNLKNSKYTVAMARTNDPDSATSQFFINTVDNFFLDKSDESDGYAVFGKVISGTDVVDKIAKVKTIRTKGYSDVPAKAVEILDASVTFDGK